MATGGIRGRRDKVRLLSSTSTFIYCPMTCSAIDQSYNATCTADPAVSDRRLQSIETSQLQCRDEPEEADDR